MNYSAALDYLYSLGNEVSTAKLGLHNIAALLKFLGDPHKKFKSVLIAGTNGKGSVAAFCESILRMSGYKTGLYTSPHLIRVEERIRTKGCMISAEDFARLAGEVKDAVATLLAEFCSDGSRLRLSRHPTYFEMVTAIAFKYFAEQQLDIAVLEVGLGGRYDATNVIDALVAVITNVDYDHEKFLGSRLEEIAAEKAGIIKPRSYESLRPQNELPVVFCNGSDTVVEVIEKRCKATGARLIRVLEGIEYKAEAKPLGYFRLQLNSNFGDEIEINIPLAGEHQVLNVLTAIRTAELLRTFGYQINGQNVREGIAKTRWPGRLEILDSQPRIILDGAHNAAGAEKVRQYIQRFLKPQQIVMVFGVMRDKAIREMARTLFPLARQIILTRPTWDRAADPEEIGNLVSEFRHLFRFTKTVGEALDLAQLLASKDDTILIVGSLFLVGDAKRSL